MSDSTAIALITASFFSGTLVFFYISSLTDRIGYGIASGVIQGSPASTKWRWLVLHQSWVGYAAATMGSGVMVAVVNVEIASLATDADVRTVAYLAALFGGVAALGWLLGGISDYVYFRSVLRQAEAN